MDLQKTDQKPILKWQSREFIPSDRGAKWYTFVSVIGLLVLAFFIWQRIWTGVVLLVVSVLYLFFSSRINSKNLDYSLYEDGVVLAGKVFHFDQFKSFWLVYGDLPKIKFLRAGRLGGELVMPLENVSEDDVRKFLATKLPEEVSSGEDWIDKLHKIIGI